MLRYVWFSIKVEFLLLIWGMKMVVAQVFPSKWWTLEGRKKISEPKNRRKWWLHFLLQGVWFLSLAKGIYSLRGMQRKSFAFFFNSVKYQRRFPAEQPMHWAGRGMNFSAALSLPFSPFLSLSLFSCRFSRYAAKTRSSPAACERAELLPPECQQLRRLHPEFKEEINRWINKWTEISCLSICTQTRFLEQAYGSGLGGILIH